MNKISIFSTTNLERGGALLLVTAALVVGSAPRLRAAGDPTDVVQRTTSEVIDVLQQREVPSERKQEQILAIVERYVDFDTVSKLVLARHWRTLGEDKQRQFVEEFKTHLAVTYGKNVDNYQNEKVEIRGTRDEARGDKTVQTYIVRGGGQKPFVVDYRVREIGGEWKIIDVIVEGVSLVANFRSQFQQILASGGIDRLLKLLREKNAKGEATETAPGIKS